MTIFVDADGCPVVDDVIEVTDNQPGEWSIHVIHNRHHNLAVDHARVTVVETGDRPDEADHYIYNHLNEGDIVVTDDLGLAALVLKRGATVIRFRGDTVDEDDIEHRLIMRHVSAKARREDKHRGGPSAFDDQDRGRFRQVLKNHLDETHDPSSSNDDQ